MPRPIGNRAHVGFIFINPGGKGPPRTYFLLFLSVNIPLSGIIFFIWDINYGSRPTRAAVCDARGAQGPLNRQAGLD